MHTHQCRHYPYFLHSPQKNLRQLSDLIDPEIRKNVMFIWKMMSHFIFIWKMMAHFFINEIKLLTSGCSFPLVAFDATQEWFKLLRAVLYASKNRAAMRSTESWLKMLWNGGSAAFSPSEEVNNGSQTKCAPVLFSDWAVDVPSPACCLLAWCLNSFWWRNSIEHRVHLWEALSLRRLSWVRTCRFIEPEWHWKRR